MSSAPLTICQVVPTLSPDYGGPPVVAVQLAAGQAALGHCVHVFGHEGPGEGAKIDAMLAKMPGSERIQFHRIPSTTRREALLGAALRAELETIAGETDLLHLHGVWEPELTAAARVAWKRRIPYVVTPHGMLDPYSLDQKRLKKMTMLRLWHRRLLNRAAALHLLNADERALIGPLGLTAPQEVIPNGVHLNEIDPLPEPGLFRARFPQLDDRPYFLFLSRLHHKKGLDLLIDAFKPFIDEGGTHDLVIAGPDGGVRQEVERQVAAYGLDRRVHLVGPQYGVDKYAALRDADAFVLTSRQEGFSIAITEALACGLPVLISENCHFPEVAQAAAGLVLPLERAEIVEGLHQLAADPPAAREMGARGRALVESYFTWPTICARMIAWYGGLCRCS
jgi:glycosyltransferase involved in cell wall biosynthesis